MKKFYCMLAAALAIAGASAATPPSAGVRSVAAGLMHAQVEASALDATPSAIQQCDEAIASVAPGLVQATQRGSESFSLADAERMPIEPTALTEPSLTAEFVEGVFSAPLLAPRKVAATVKAGTLFTKDLNYQGNTYTSRITLDKAEGDDATAYTITNIYGLGTTVNAVIDADASTVTIPCQTVYSNSSGDIKICPINIADGRITYNTGDVVGAIDANGKITLGGWGLLITEGDNAGRGYNLFISSEWTPANATVVATDISDDTNIVDVTYECLVEQTADNTLTFYGLSGVTSETITSRLTAAKSVLVPNSYVYANMYYGYFYLFPYDLTTGKATAGVNLVGTYAEGIISFPAWAIASREYPTSYVGYKFKDIKVTTNLEIVWPEAPVMDFSGKGTADDPYVIATVKQFDALASLVAEGNDFEGVSFTLGSDLDFSTVAPTSFQPIGDANTPFNGTFDGLNHTVKNLTVKNYNFYHLGLFGNIGAKGTVKNLNIADFYLTMGGSYAGCVAGQSSGVIDNVNVVNSTLVGNCELLGGIVGAAIDATITNCSFNGQMQGNGSVAGIVGQSVGSQDHFTTIDNCHSRLVVLHSGYFSSSCRDAGGIGGLTHRTILTNSTAEGIIQDNAGYAASGGLVGRATTQSSISGCTSAVAIRATANSSVGSTTGTVINCYQGGLFGYVFDCAEVRNCISSSYVFQDTYAAADYVGGLVGYLSVGYSYSSSTGSKMVYLTKFYDCIFNGQVYTASSASHNNLYGITFHSTSWDGDLPEDLAFTNCYFDSQVALNAGDRRGRPTSFFTAGLPEGFDASAWTAVPGGYPIVTATATQPASLLASSALVLADGQSSAKVSRPFTIANSDVVTWGISTTDGVVQESDALVISGSTVNIKDQYANAVLVAETSDGWGMKMLRLAIVPKWFDGDGTAESPYLLKNADDFLLLDTAVGTYNQAHVGDFFKVTNDIDFADSAFKGVAYGKGSSTMFGGTLDGDGHTLHNINVDGVAFDAEGAVDNANSTSIIGVICIIHPFGTVKNLNVAADCSFKGYTYTGGIAGANFGRIENCRNYAAITGYHNYAGGIVAASMQTEYDEVVYVGTISGCYNGGAVVGAYNSYGGIVGYNSGVIELCQNDGAVTGQSLVEGSTTKHNTVGGIAGSNYNSIDRCVNNAAVTACYAVGGIAGYINSGSVTRSVDNGYVYSTDLDARRGAIIGQLGSKKEIEANYYDASINVNGGVNNAGATGVAGLATAVITSGTAPEGLSADDFDFAAGKYPVLKAFAAEPLAETLRTMAIYFAEGQARSNVQTPVALAAGTEWSLTVGTSFAIADNTLTPTLPTDINVVNDTLTATKAGQVKVFPIAIIPTILSGKGTEESPYLIQTPEDWNTLADFMLANKYEYDGEYFRITDDLDFKNDSIHLLAVNGVKFSGILDGNGKTVKNYLYGNTNSTSVVTKWVGPNFYRGVSIGLIGTLGAEGVVKNLTVNGSFSAVNSLGGIVGEVYGTVDNCVHAGTISNTSGSNVSGIAYRVYDGGKILNCVNNGNVTTKTTYANGIVGNINDGGLVEGCVNNGNVTSGSTAASGIAYNVAGILRNCANHGLLAGTGTAAGIVNTVAKTGKVEDCYNDADILYEAGGGNIAGVVYNTSDQTASDLEEPTSWVKRCYNTGNLNGKANVFGFACTIKKGVLVEDCYNTGSVTAVTTYGTFGFCGAVTANNAEGLLPTTILRCFNTGDVTSETVSSACASGFAKSTAAGTIMTDCYNLGNVTVKGQPTSSSAICCATGLIGNISGGTITRCFNAGDVYGLTPCNGGLAGYAAGSNSITFIEDCFNLGDVTGSQIYLKSGTPTDGNANGTAGGLFGYISAGNPSIRNCFNAGNVYGDKRVGGLAGGMFESSKTSTVVNCYNSGKIICENSWWNGTIYHRDYDEGVDLYVNSHDVYFDVTVNPNGSYQETRNFPGSAKTTAQMFDLDLGDAFVTGYGYPMLASMLQSDNAVVRGVASVASAGIRLLNLGDTYDNVTGLFYATAGPDAVWTCEGEGEVVFKEGVGVPTKEGKVTVTATSVDGTVARSFDLVINGTFYSGIDDLDAAGKTVVSATYVDMAGRTLPAPAANQPYIVKVTFGDGTTVVRKVIARD